MVIILKQNRVFNTVRIFFNSSDEAKELIERSQRFNFNNSDERKQLIELCQICYFNGREVNRVVSVVRDFILVVAKKNRVVSVVRDFIIIAGK